MSTATEKRANAEALQDAIDFCDLFPRECYERWEFAGSIRRHKAFVGDVEHVIIPAFKNEVITTGGLFGSTQESKTTNLLWQRLDGLVNSTRPMADGSVSKHLYTINLKSGEKRQQHKWGELLRGTDFRGFNQEIFLADADNWGSQLAIRTGPAEYSQMLVSKLQWNGYMNDGGYVLDKNDSTCVCGWRGKAAKIDGKLAGGFVSDLEGRESGPKTDVCPACLAKGEQQIAIPVRVPAPDERTYFKLCGVEWVDPPKRFAPTR